MTLTDEGLIAIPGLAIAGKPKGAAADEARPVDVKDLMP